MNAIAEIVTTGGVTDGNLARRILDPLSEADGLVRYLAEIQFDRVRLMQPLARDMRSDARPRAERRLDELPSDDDLRQWYEIAKAALAGQPEEERCRVLVALMLDVLRGPLPNPRITIDAFVVALEDAGHSPQIVAGGVKRAWSKCRTKPSISAFLTLCREHRAEVQVAQDAITRTMGLRRDAEKVLATATGLVASPAARLGSEASRGYRTD